MSKHKYNAVKSNGFASKLENAVYDILKLREKAGEIKNIQCQDAVELTDAKIRCKIDFSFIDCKSKKKVYCESKGVITERWRIIKKLWQIFGPGKLEIWKGNYKNPKMVEIVIPN